MNFREWADHYAENGIPIFPLWPKEKTPLSTHGVKDATCDPDVVEHWWTLHPEANIGIALGAKSGLCGLDVDVKEGADPDILSRLPPTYTTLTPTGGSHPLFVFPKDRTIPNAKKIERGVTYRGEGYYFVAPPSIHPLTLTAYTPKNNVPLWKADLATIPDWIATCQPFKLKQTSQDKIPEGSRHEALKRFAVALRKCGKSIDEIKIRIAEYNQKFLAAPKSIDELEAICNWVGLNITPDPKAGQAELLNEESASFLESKFKLYVGKDHSKVYEVISQEKRELENILNPEYISKSLADSLREQNPQPPQVKQALNRWRLETSCLSTPPESFLWPEEEGWTLKRLEFVPTEGRFESWKEFLFRLSSPEDFMAYIWSIFEPQNRSRQFLYLYDPNGQGGKSTVIRVIGDVLGNAFCALSNQVVSGEAQRWLHSMLYGRRLAGWSDCKNPKFCMSELVRNITSGDPVVVEAKGEAPFTTTMRLKLIIGSNVPPEISDEGANNSRLIRIDVADNTFCKDNPEWEHRLKAELPAFLFECKGWYNKACKANGEIAIRPTTQALILNSSVGIESRYEDILERRIQFADSYETSVTDWEKLRREERLDNCATGELKRILCNRGARIEKLRPWDPIAKKQSTKVSYKGFRILSEITSAFNIQKENL